MTGIGRGKLALWPEAVVLGRRTLPSHTKTLRA